MTRKTYLRNLEKNISSLSEAEIKDAIAYYSNYFDDADDDEKVINELGSAEDLAAKIIENSKKRVAALETSVDSDSGKNEGESESDALYYEFDREVIKSLQMNLGAAEIVLIPGKNLCVESRGIEEDALSCVLTTKGGLTITNEKRVNFDFFNHGRKFRVVPRLLITIPEQLCVESLKIRIGAGSLITKGISLNANTASFEVGAGNVSLDTLNCGGSKFRCGMGNLTYTGSLIGHCDIDCGMGNVKLTLTGNADEYSYDGKVGLGDLKINDEKKSGVGQIECSEKKSNHLSINVGMGSVFVKIAQ